MKIEEWLDKKEAREVSILRKVILAGGRVEDTVLLNYLGVSKASFESDLKELAFYLKPYEKECSLFYDGHWVTLDMTDHFSIRKVFEDYVRASIKFQLMDYLFQHQAFTIVQLTTKFVISESSLFRKIKELNYLLEEFELKIRNGQLKGEELQIRYFYFQLYWFLTPYDQHRETIPLQNVRVIESFEKGLSLTFDVYSKLKLSLWLTISKKRMVIQPKTYQQLNKKSETYKQDPLYQKVRLIVLRFLSRYPVEMDEEESMLHFVFLMSMSILSEQDFERYNLIRGRRTPTSLADTFLLEYVILYYRPQKFFPTLEKQIFYYFSQIHMRLYFFKGELEIVERDTILVKEQQLSSHHLFEFSQILLSKSLEYFGEKYQPGNSLHEWSLVNYLSVLAIIDFDILGEIRMGIDLEMDHLYKQVMMQVLVLSLKNLNGLIIETYNPQNEYDLIVTNVMRPQGYASAKEFYVLSELVSAYDVNQIRNKIRDLYGNRRIQ